VRRIALATALCLTAPAIALVSSADAAPTVRITNQAVRSFDGIRLATTLFVPRGASSSHPVPVVLRGSGWTAPRETRDGGTIHALVDAGFAVLTWDPRGFGGSGGATSVDALDREARDASALIDWAARQPFVATQRPGDPVVGMSGPSYGGAIQLATAAIDHRIDAIAPEITWFDLRAALFPNGVAKRGGWAEWLFGSGFASRTEDDAWLLARSLAGYGDTHPIAAPTLVVQGIDDELFDLNEAARTLAYLDAHHVPHRFVAFCGGHGTCRHPDTDDRAHLDHALVTWFDRWLRDNTRADVGPAAEYRTNDGRWRAVDAFPPTDTAPRYALAAGNTPITATVVGASGDAVGLPHASIDAPPTAAGATLFLELVDREAGEVLGNQSRPVRVTSTHLEVELVGVAHTLAAGHHLDVRVTSDRPVVGLSVVVSVPVRDAA
jgi:ABC-2 type transport system ATP-binding protein